MNKPYQQDLLLNMALFAEVAELGSFSATAERLQMTPSSVSKRIAKLENDLGVKLLERTTRSMRLTTTGERLLVHCQNMLHEADTAVNIAHATHDTLSGDISISAPIAFAKHVLHPLVMEFMHQYPDIHIRLLCTDDTVDLLRENIDISIEIGDTPSEFIIAKPFRAIRQVLCTSPDYLNTHPQPLKHPQDLHAHHCLYLGETDTDKQWQFIKNGHVETVTISGRYATNDSAMRLQGVLKGLGIGCFPDFVVHHTLAQGKVMEVLTDWQLQSKYHGMAWVTYLPNKFQTLRLTTFINFLLQNKNNPAI